MFLTIISIGLIVGIISLVYKPMYSVTLNGEFIGYTENKSKMQKQISEYMEQGEEEIVAFVDIEKLPEYSLCLVKRNKESNDDEIYEKIKSLGTTYYEYYAIVLDSEEKYYVKTKEEAEEIIDKLKEKESSNISKIAYTQLHKTELQEFSEIDKVVDSLYVKKKVYVVAANYSASEETYAPDLGIKLSKPAYGIVTSRYGARWGKTHSGIDIAANTETPIYAAASGTVVYSGNSGNGYGNYIIIRHNDTVQTLYGHCNRLYVSAGDYVSTGQNIAAMGSTGNSTGPHLHFEIIVNGQKVNPQNYLY